MEKHEIVEARELELNDIIYLPEKPEHKGNLTLSGYFWVCKVTKNCRELRNRFRWFWIKDLSQKVCKVAEVTNDFIRI